MFWDVEKEYACDVKWVSEVWERGMRCGNIRIYHECEGGIENLSRGSPIGIKRLAE